MIKTSHSTYLGVTGDYVKLRFIKIIGNTETKVVLVVLIVVMWTYLTTLLKVSPSLSPMNGENPESKMYVMTPMAHISVLVVT